MPSFFEEYFQHVGTLRHEVPILNEALSEPADLTRMPGWSEMENQPRERVLFNGRPALVATTVNPLVPIPLPRTSKRKRAPCHLSRPRQQTTREKSKEMTMGLVQRRQEEHDVKVYKAMELCVEVGAVEECVLHSGEYIDQTVMDTEEIADAVLKIRPSAIDDFKDRADMLQCIQEALDSIGYECGVCAQHAD